MRIRCRGWAVGYVASLLVTTSSLAGQAPGYLDYEALSTELRSLTDGSDLATLESLATTLEEREVWLVRVGEPGGVPLDERPGVLVVGNLEGDHLVGSQLVLEMGRFLLSGEDELAPVLAQNVFYLIPRLNPDGAEAMFADVLIEATGNRRPFDDDNDGRVDEDPPEDLDGNGLVTVMRVPDPLGLYVPDAADPRLMVEAEPGQGRAGAFSVYWEGVDSDGDGFFNEDWVGGVDLNRNFQHEYPYYGPGAGPHMVSELESRGLMDFVIAHRNIAAVLAFGHSDNLVTPPDGEGALAPPATLSLPALATASNAEVFDIGVFSAESPTGALELRGVQPGADNAPDSGERPAVTVRDEDLEYYEAVSERYREITGIEAVSVNREAEGAFFGYGYYQFGVPSFTTQGWGLARSAEDSDAEDGADERSAEAELLRALEADGIDAFVDWGPIDHPDLGEVEIGGFRPYAATNPPADRLAELGRSHGQFLLSLAGMLPRIRVASSEVEGHGGGLFTVTVEIENSGFFPSAVQQGVVAGSVDPITVRIGVASENLITGDELTSRIDQLEGSGTRARFSWLIRGAEGEAVEVRVRSQKGGSDTVTVTLGDQP